MSADHEPLANPAVPGMSPKERGLAARKLRILAERVPRGTNLHRKLRQAASALEPAGLELWEYDVHSALRRQGKPYALPATRLARQTELSTGAMTNRIDRLEDRGFVARRADKVDRRSVIVRLTPTGLREIDKAIGYRLEAARDSVRHLTAKQRRDLSELLRLVVLDAQENPG